MNKIKNLSQLNHFEKFSFTPNLDIDIDDLETKYLQFQQQFHPDSLINKNQNEQNMAISNSIAINEAYEILKHPLKRAIYLLKLNAIDINDDDCHVKPTGETLMMVLELKEQLFNNQNSEETAKIKNLVNDKIKKLMSEIAGILENKEYKLAAEKLIEVKYLDKILVDLKLQKRKK